MHKLHLLVTSKFDNFFARGQWVTLNALASTSTTYQNKRNQFNYFIIRNISWFFLRNIIHVSGQTKKYVCLRSPDRPYFSATDPNLYYRQLFDLIFASDPINFYTELG